jgi:hypothetical protein
LLIFFIANLLGFVVGLLEFALRDSQPLGHSAEVAREIRVCFFCLRQPLLQRL